MALPCRAYWATTKKGRSMRYQITGKQIDIGEALQTHVQDELGAVLHKYSQRPTDATIVFSKSAHEFVCEATVHLSSGLTAAAKAHANEIYAAFDGCAEKMDKQLRRYKRRLKDHHKERAQPVELSQGSSYILASDEHDHESEPETLQPVIIAEMETKIPSLTVGEAVMQMELAGAPVLVFKNETKDSVNVVYRRDDGNIGWIDPKKRLMLNIASIAHAAYGISETQAVDSLLERESLGPTGVGQGIALPHARVPGLEGVVGVFVLLQKPIDFGSVDRLPVDMAFALFAPETAGVEHLKALALVSRSLRDTGLCTKIRSNPDAGMIYTILTEAETVQAA
ncbi:unnamed protein product [Cyprideis torosa]|uniref:Uncharacterized protein n=1 Tax=Cyprideis torosa TaxID=163714 RepID=A0A7R8ZX10_9CRUS|nr:unnamed protein product [Cyprideis torosa]CAG0909699.1 unnamed protein product [Cyprideis torosa]